MELKQFIRILVWVFGLFVLLVVLWAARQVATYFFISIIFALIGRPLMKLLGKIQYKNFKFPKALAAAIVILGFISVVALAFGFIFPIIGRQVQILAKIDPNNALEAYDGFIKSVEIWLNKMNITQFNRTYVEDKLSSYLDFSIVTNIFNSFISQLGNILIGFMSVLFISFFLLKDKNIVNNIIDTVTPDKYLGNVHHIITETKDLLSRYFIGIVLQISIISSVIAIGLSIAGVQNALLIGVLAGLFNLIPYIGPLIGGTIAILLSILSQHNMAMDTAMLPLIGKVVVVISIAQLLDNFVLQPLIFSKSVKAHPLEIFIVIILGGSLAGIGGMILAVPVYTFLRIVAKEFFLGYKIVEGLTKNL